MTQDPLTELVVGLHIKITTRTLSLPYLDPDHEDRLKLIYDLHLQGLTSPEISDYLNDRNLKPPRSDRPYYFELVWGSLDKYRKRLERLKDTTVEISRPKLLRLERKK